MSATTVRPPGSPNQPTKNWSDQVTGKGNNLPSRFVMHGVEGVGKSSFAAHAPKPIFLMSRGETGLETLIDSGRVGDVPHLPEIESWSDTLSAIDWLTNAEHDYKTAVLDTLNGFERLCHEHVCKRDYGGRWGKDGFSSYMQGYDVSQADWRELLIALDRLRSTKRMAVICLCHTKVTRFSNPEGLDFDRYCPALHEKTWNLTHRWADIVGFANFYVEAVKDGAKAKARGGQDRVLYTERHAAFDAKNRNGLPSEISMGNSGTEAWANFMEAIKAAKESK